MLNNNCAWYIVTVHSIWIFVSHSEKHRKRLLLSIRKNIVCIRLFFLRVCTLYARVWLLLPSNSSLLLLGAFFVPPIQTIHLFRVVYIIFAHTTYRISYLCIHMWCWIDDRYRHIIIFAWIYGILAKFMHLSNGLWFTSSSIFHSFIYVTSNVFVKKQ